MFSCLAGKNSSNKNGGFYQQQDKRHKTATIFNRRSNQRLASLREIVSVGSNRNCFDCGQRGPTYVNMTVGSFVCTTCSGRLRGLNPPHRVKSISMASFTNEEMEFIKDRGNEFCRKVWLGLYDSKSSGELDTSEDSKLIDAMTRRYEKKQWYVAPTDAMHEEARKANTEAALRKNEISTSRSNSSINTQSIQRPVPGTVRALPGMAGISPTSSSLPQSPVKFSPQTPKSGVALDSPKFLYQTPNTGFANFANFSSQSSSPPVQTASVSTSFNPPGFFQKTQPTVFSSQQFSAVSTAPPTSSDRYAALADITAGQHVYTPAINWDGTYRDQGTDVPVWQDGEQFLNNIHYHYVNARNSQVVSRPGVNPATNPFMTPPLAMSSAPFQQPVQPGFAQFGSMPSGSDVRYGQFGGAPMYVHPAQEGYRNVWGVASPGYPTQVAQQASFHRPSNPFMNVARHDNVTNPFL